VLNNQPQGGFVTRKPSVDVRVANGIVQDDDGFGSFFQRGWEPQTVDPRPVDPRTVDPRRRGVRYYQVQQGWW
jgi:hypothetical protein